MAFPAISQLCGDFCFLKNLPVSSVNSSFLKYEQHFQIGFHGGFTNIQEATSVKQNYCHPIISDRVPAFAW